MNKCVASGAERDQILLGITSAATSDFRVVNFQIRSRSTGLASPTIASEHLQTKLFVRFRIKPQTGLFRENSIHEAFSVTSWRNACRCSPGRNLKKRASDCRSTVGSSPSRFAPARKSAQIISRQ